MRRLLTTLVIGAALAACQRGTVERGDWSAWQEIDRRSPRRATINSPDQVVQNRESWRGAADLSAEFIAAQSRTRLTILAEITDDRPLQQSRPERVHPGWWLMRMGGDSLVIALGTGDGRVEVPVVLGSAGISPAILDGGEGDAVQVWPMVTGARVLLEIDLAARGFDGASPLPVEISVHDIDSAADWSVLRGRLR